MTLLEPGMTEEQIQLWRNEHPLDYVACFRQLENPPTNNENAERYFLNRFFEVFYKTSRYHVPRALYKYYSLTDDEDLNKVKLETLAACKVFTSPTSQLNDPFDGKGYFYDLGRVRATTHTSDLDNSQIDFASMIRVSSFTACDYSSMPMWAHYANNHRGYCVRYVVDDTTNFDLKVNAFPVQYVERRVDITNLVCRQFVSIRAQAETSMSLGTQNTFVVDPTLVYVPIMLENLKHAHWAYEKEIRCSVAANGPYVPHIAAVPDAIYIGKNCSSEHMDELVSIGCSLGIPIYRMIFNPLSSEFKLEAQEVAIE